MTERKYYLNRWYPHGGGPCPVPRKAKATILAKHGSKFDVVAEDCHWPNIVAFCVTEYPDEEETRTGECWAYHYKSSAPTLVEVAVGERCVRGTYTATIVNGKPKRIVWDADE
jgi:hypothetical protein